MERTIFGTETQIELRTIVAYRATSYLTADTPVGPVVLRIDQHSETLERLVYRSGIPGAERDGAAFITAFNPYGVLLPSEQNEHRHQMLEGIIARNGWPYFEGFGVGSEGTDWEPERSFLILGIDRTAASNIGLLMQQNAIVYARAQSTAELMLLR